MDAGGAAFIVNLIISFSGRGRGGGRKIGNEGGGREGREKKDTEEGEKRGRKIKPGKEEEEKCKLLFL